MKNVRNLEQELDPKVLDPNERSTGEISQSEFEELLLNDIFIELEAGDDDYWEKKAMELAELPDLGPTPEQRAAFERRLDLEVKRIQNQKRQIAQARNLRRQHTMRILSKVAMVVAAITIFMGVTLYHTVEAFAAGIDRFVATVLPDEGAEELRIEEKQGRDVELNVEDFRGMYIPDRIPWGYFISSVEICPGHNKIIYINKNNDVVSYEVAKSGTSFFVDDEEVSEKQIYILGTYGRMIDTDETIYVIWEDEDYIYTVAGNTELRDELIKMVESCIKTD